MEAYHPGGSVPSTENIKEFKTLGNILRQSFDTLQGDNFANSNEVDHNIHVHTDFDPRRHRQCENFGAGGENLTVSSRVNFHGGAVERNDSHTVAVASHPYGILQPISNENRVWSWSQSGNESLVRPVALYPEENRYYWGIGEGEPHTHPSSNRVTLTRSEGHRSNTQYFPASNEQYQVYISVDDIDEPQVSTLPIVTDNAPRLPVPEPNHSYQFRPITQQSASEGSHQNSIQCQQVPKKRKPRYLEDTDTTVSTNIVPSTSILVPSEQLNSNSGSNSSSFTVSLPGGAPLFTIPLVGQAQAIPAKEGKRPLVKKKNKARTVVYRSQSYQMENLNFRKLRSACRVPSVDIPDFNMDDSSSLPSPGLLNYNAESDSKVPKPSKSRSAFKMKDKDTRTCKMCNVCKKPKWRNKVSKAIGQCKCKVKSQDAPKPQVSGKIMKQVYPKRSSLRIGVENPATPKSRSSSVEVLSKGKGQKNQQALSEGSDSDTRPMEVETVEQEESNQTSEKGNKTDQQPQQQQPNLDMPDIFQLFQSKESTTPGNPSSSSSTEGLIIDSSANELSGNIHSEEEKIENGPENQDEMPHCSNAIAGCSNEIVSEAVQTPLSQLSTIVATSSSDDDEIAEYLSVKNINASSGQLLDQNCDKTCSIKVTAQASNAQRIHSARFSDISDGSNRETEQLAKRVPEVEVISISDDEILDVENNFEEGGHFTRSGDQVATTQQGATSEAYHLPENVYPGMPKENNDIEASQHGSTYGSYATPANRNVPITTDDQPIISSGPESNSFRPISFGPQYNGDMALLPNIFNGGHYDNKIISLQGNEDRYNDMNIFLIPAHQVRTSHLRDLYQNIGPRGQCKTGPYAHLDQLLHLTSKPPPSNHSPFEATPNGNPWQLQIPDTDWNESNRPTFEHMAVANVVGQEGFKTIPNQMDSGSGIRDAIDKSNTRDTSVDYSPFRKAPNVAMPEPRGAARDESFLRSKGRICKFDEEGVKTVTRIAHKIISQNKVTSEPLKQVGRKYSPKEPTVPKSTPPPKKIAPKSAKSDVVPPARLGKMLKKFATEVGRKQKVSRIQEKLMEDVQKVYRLGSGSDASASKPRTKLQLKEVSMSIPGPFERRLRANQEKNSALPSKQTEQDNNVRVEQEPSRIGEPVAETSSRVAAPSSTNGNDKIDAAKPDTSDNNDPIPMQRNLTPISDDDDILSLHADESLDDIL